MAAPIIRAGRSFFVYLHRRATDGKVFYVGKGTGNRAERLDSRSQHWRCIVARHGFVVEYVVRDVQEWYAFEIERELIAYYGRDSLCNKTDGGEGTAGLVMSAEAKAIRSRIQTGRNHSAEMKMKISEGVRRANAAGPKKPLSAEHRKKLSIAAKGRSIKPTEEARRNMSAAAKARCAANPMSEEERQRRSILMRKINGTEEVRQRISAQRKAYWASRRDQTQVP